MNLRPIAVASVLLAAAAALSLPAPVASLHTDPGQSTCCTGVTDVSGSFHVQLSTAVWWSHHTVHGIPTGLEEQTRSFHLKNPNTHVLVTAEAIPYVDLDGDGINDNLDADSTNDVDVAPVCGLPFVAPVIAPNAVVWGTTAVPATSCVKVNGFSIQVHYFAFRSSPASADDDHIISPNTNTPLATFDWHVDAVPTSYKTAIIPPIAGDGYEIWLDPAVSGGEHDIRYRFQAVSSSGVPSTTPFDVDYMGWRGCIFYTDIGGFASDQSLAGCPTGYGDEAGP